MYINLDMPDRPADAISEPLSLRSLRLRLGIVVAEMQRQGAEDLLHSCLLEQLGKVKDTGDYHLRVQSSV